MKSVTRFFFFLAFSTMLLFVPVARANGFRDRLTKTFARVYHDGKGVAKVAKNATLNKDCIGEECVRPTDPRAEPLDLRGYRVPPPPRPATLRPSPPPMAP